METMLFTSSGRQKRRQRDERVYADYIELMSVEGQSATGVIRFLMQKYGIDSASTVYAIKKRMEKNSRERRANP